MFDLVVKKHFTTLDLDIEIKVTNVTGVLFFKLRDLQVVRGYYPDGFFCD